MSSPNNDDNSKCVPEEGDTQNLKNCKICGSIDPATQTAVGSPCYTLPPMCTPQSSKPNCISAYKAGRVGMEKDKPAGTLPTVAQCSLASIQSNTPCITKSSKQKSDFCQEIEKHQAEVEKTASKWKGITQIVDGAMIAAGGAVGGPWVAAAVAGGVAGNMLAAKSKSANTYFALQKTYMSLVEKNTENNTCSNIRNEAQNNVVNIDNRKCVDLYKGLGYSSDVINKIVEAGVTINQTNKSQSFQKCALQSAIAVMASQTSSAASIALQKAVSKAKGLLTAAEADNNNCIDNETNNQICIDSKIAQCCLDNAYLLQSNKTTIQCPMGPTSISQSNTDVAIQQCTLSATGSLSATQVSSLFDQVEQTAEATSIGLTPMMLFMMILASMLFILIPEIEFGFIGYEVFKFLGPMLIVGGIIALAYAKTKESKSVTVTDHAMSKCKSTRVGTDPAKVYYRNIKNIDEDDTYIAYDFFPDSPTSTGLPKPNDKGIVVYISSVDRSQYTDYSKKECGEKKTKSVSYIKAYSDKTINYVGYALVIGGILFTSMSIFMTSDKKKSSKKKV